MKPKYGVKHLVYFETFNDIHAAIHRETRLKKWNRQAWPEWLLAATGSD